MGDVNGDGTGDILIGWWSDDHDGFDRGTGFIQFGIAHGLTTTADWFFDHGLEGAAAAAGDVNGDDLDDVIVGNPLHRNEHGRDVGSASMFLGRKAALKEVQDSFSSSTVVLHSNYSNPSNPVTTIRFELQERMLVRIDVFGVKGEHVTTVCNGVSPQGVHDVLRAASNVASGFCFARLKAENRVVTRRMLLLK